MAEGLARRGFDVDLRDGEAAEDAFVHTFLRARVEVKMDEKAITTGRVAIEYEQICRDGKVRISGISTTEAHNWALVLPGLCTVLIETERLKALSRAAIKAKEHAWVGDNNHHHCAFVPVEWLVRPWRPA